MKLQEFRVRLLKFHSNHCNLNILGRTTFQHKTMTRLEKIEKDTTDQSSDTPDQSSDTPDQSAYDTDNIPTDHQEIR